MWLFGVGRWIAANQHPPHEWGLRLTKRIHGLAGEPSQRSSSLREIAPEGRPETKQCLSPPDRPGSTGLAQSDRNERKATESSSPADAGPRAQGTGGVSGVEGQPPENDVWIRARMETTPDRPAAG